MTSAETAYLFRHALLRDAAYELQLPADRARLHALAFHLIEQAFGGRAPEPPSLDAIDPPKCVPHPTDAVAAELAWHAERAHGDSGEPEFPDHRRRYLQRAADYHERHFQLQQALSNWQQLAGLTQGVIKAGVQRAAARTLIAMGLSLDAAPWLEEAMQTFNRNGNRPGGTGCAINLVAVYRDTGRIQQAEALAQAALQSARAEQDRYAQSILTAEIAGIYQITSRHDLAEQAYLEALELQRKFGDDRMVFITLTNLAGVYTAINRISEAESVYHQARDILARNPNKRFEGILLSGLGSAFRAQGRLQDAERAQQGALAIARETGNRREEGMALANLAVVFATAGRERQAEQAFLDALDLHREVDDPRFEGITLGNLGYFYEHAGRADDAVRTYLEAARVAGRLGDLRTQCLALDNLTALQLQAGRPAKALETSREALAIQRRRGYRRGEGVSQCALATSLAALGMHPDAAKEWEQGSRLLREEGATELLQSCAELMRSACSKAGVPPLDAGDTPA
ncbi:MAG: tetratricopeptide repeat protein [Planctomycetes bacterium]|nr:tetratricopeptide repeat protein [Planctomycetota bacterium]MCW8136698.1 tetratricopeptide repeat protein [Planctomycetota bacterium]